jgi:hypothetical protein
MKINSMTSKSRNTKSIYYEFRSAKKADEWFRHSEGAHTFLDPYSNDTVCDKRRRKVKIAVLDTGIAICDGQPELVKEKRPCIKFGKKVKDSLPPWEDLNGHGTHTAGLILRVCPYADVYVYRIVEDTYHTATDEDPIDRKLAAEALLDATAKGMDIVSMSFGWPSHKDDELHKAIERVKAKKLLLFAATSNDSGRAGASMAYPASADEVIGIDAADGFGNPSKFNPPEGGDFRFAALGEAVRSAYPVHRGVMRGEQTPGWRRMSGTSCATPIAAGIAGLVLEFARQQPMCYDESIESHLKMVAGMRQVLRDLFAVKVREASRFNHLDPQKLFCVNDKYKEGGMWYENSSPRLYAANTIVRCLRTKSSDEIGTLMDRKVEEEWSNRNRNSEK